MTMPKYPTSDQCVKLLQFLKRGAEITPLIAVHWGIGLRLSQRVIELEALGWKIERGWYKLKPRGQVRTYRLAK